MPWIRPLKLSDEQRAELEGMRDHHPRPHFREKAAALLKVAAGLPAAQVAREGLLKPRDYDTVYEWMDRYEQAGIAGLAVRPGRGRKSAFSPSAARRGPGQDGAVERAAQPAQRRRS